MSLCTLSTLTLGTLSSLNLVLPLCPVVNQPVFKPGVNLQLLQLPLHACQFFRQHKCGCVTQADLVWFTCHLSTSPIWPVLHHHRSYPVVSTWNLPDPLWYSLEPVEKQCILYLCQWRAKEAPKNQNSCAICKDSPEPGTCENTLTCQTFCR